MTQPTLVKPGAALVLQPPAAVTVIETEQVDPFAPDGGMVAVDEAQREVLRANAEAFVADLATVPPKSPAFQAKVQEIAAVGRDELLAASNVSSRLLDRPAAALTASTGTSGVDAPGRVAKNLVELRTVVEELTPNRADLTGAKKILKFLPGGDKIANYFKKYQSAQSQLDAITRALEAGQDELLRDNAAIEREQANMWTLMGQISQWAYLLAAVDAEVNRQIEAVKVSDPNRADALKADALFAVRQRHEDLLTNLAVAVQGYLALQMVHQNNVELSKGVDRARTTTLAALRTAVILHQALTNQELVLNQIKALNATTSDLIVKNSEMLKQNSVAIHRQAVESTVEIGALETAFQNVFDTMDEIDRFRLEAADSFKTTITSLETQVSRAKPYLERANVQQQIAQA